MAKTCIARGTSVAEQENDLLRCLYCQERRHCNCYRLQRVSEEVSCWKCGEGGHQGMDCVVKR